uniref:G-protein coupled receptors family 1 profile domain-containing protein n=1 Tax=Moniliophthora roreri TaxID=221103 RepID=A0A0W0EWF4_MONRR
MTFDDARPSASDRLLLIEAWINIFLSTNHIVLGFFHCVRKVDRPTRVIIIVASLIDLASMVMICMGALDQVAYFNQAHTIYSWYIEVSSLLTQLSGFIEQGVFLRRYWQYTREPSASLVIWLLMLGRIIICATLTGMILSRGIAAIRFANVATM